MCPGYPADKTFGVIRQMDFTSKKGGKDYERYNQVGPSTPDPGYQG